MKLVKLAVLALVAVVPLLGFSKSKLKTLAFGEVVLEPEDSVVFSLEEMPDEIGGFEVLSEYLPDGIDVEWTGKKFKTPKAGRVKYSKKEEDFVATSDDNPSGFKVSINKKTGKVSGSFKVYVAKSEKKLKSYSAKVKGYVGGELTVTIKKVGVFVGTLE